MSNTPMCIIKNRSGAPVFLSGMMIEPDEERKIPFEWLTDEGYEACKSLLATGMLEVTMIPAEPAIKPQDKSAFPKRLLDI